MTRVVIADDQALVRAGFRMILDAQPDIDVVGEAEDGRAAVRLGEERHPDIVLMDLRMPDLDGIEATELLLRSGQRTRVLILTTFDLDSYVLRAFRAGASGFLLKNVPPEDLVAGVRAIAAGEALLSPEITRKLIEHYTRAPIASDEPRLAELSARELDVLKLVAQGLSNTEIGETLFISQGTVKTHVGRILTKLDLRDRVQAVVLAYECGLVIPGGARDAGGGFPGASSDAPPAAGPSG